MVYCFRGTELWNVPGELRSHLEAANQVGRKVRCREWCGVDVLAVSWLESDGSNTPKINQTCVR
jgi:hypothetical protein